MDIETVFGFCADIQMLNLNPYVPPHIKTKVSMIIRTAQKAGMSESIITEVARRIDDLLDTEYINQAKEAHVIRWIQEIRNSTAKVKK